MTTKELEKRVKVLGTCGYGGKKILVTYRGKDYEFTTTNILAADRISDKNDVPLKYCSNSYTYKQALEYLWNEFKVNYPQTKDL